MLKKNIRELNRASISQFRVQDHLPLTIVLDNVRSLNNIGSIFRCADAFNIERIMLCGISATPPSVEIHKTALGAEDSVEWEYFPETLSAIARLKVEGYTVCCLEQVHESIELQNFAALPGARYALVVGHEVNGIDQRVVDAADVCLEIPQHGTKHSLNVSVSAGIAMWQFYCLLA